MFQTKKKRQNPRRRTKGSINKQTDKEFKVMIKICSMNLGKELMNIIRSLKELENIEKTQTELRNTITKMIF